MIGQTPLHYRVARKLGAGGRGEVYLAEDTKLGRQVAIKALPEAVSRDPERLLPAELKKATQHIAGGLRRRGN